jgi:hypothetical protein
MIAFTMVVLDELGHGAPKMNLPERNQPSEAACSDARPT